MIGITRGFSTLIGAGIAGFLIWLASTLGTETAGDYWLTYGLVAAAGLTMALSQLLGGWTKWGWPRLSAGVFLLGFLPVLLVGGWVLLARQPADFFNTSNWSRDLGVMGAVSGLGELLAAVAFGIGLTFGLTFDTTGPRRTVVTRDEELVDADARTVTPMPAHGREGPLDHERERPGARVVHDDRATRADAPLTAERTTHSHDRWDGTETERETAIRPARTDGDRT
jgi:hypothetical protein